MFRNSLPLIGPVLALENLLMTTIDASSAVFKGTIMAYGSVRQAGETDHPALMAIMQVYDTLQI